MTTTQGNVPPVIFEGQYNSDQMEGKGYGISTGPFTTPEQAFLSIKGMGGMGVSDGDVYKVTVQTVFDGQRGDHRERIYTGYQRKWAPEYANISIPRSFAEQFNHVADLIAAHPHKTSNDVHALDAARSLHRLGDVAHTQAATNLLLDTARTLGLHEQADILATLLTEITG